MGAYPYRCGRLDDHLAHEWTRPRDFNGWPRRTFWCGGHVLTEMELSRFDVADDAAEERADIERRER